MDDERIGAAIMELGTPDEPLTGDVLESMLTDVETAGRHRRAARLAVGCVAAVMVAMVGIAAWSGLRSEPPVAAHGQAKLQVHAFQYGFNWEVSFKAESDWDLTDPVWQLGEQEGSGLAYNDSRDDDATPKVLTGISIGDVIFVEGHISPRCDGTDDIPVLTVTRVSPDGSQTRSQQITPSNPDDFKQAVDTWCSLPVQAVMVQAGTSAHRTAKTYTIELNNPTSQDVTVTSTDVVSGNAHWHPSQVVVAAHGEATLTVHITSTDGHPLHVHPWPSHLFSADGTRLRLQYL